jgi:hypothetical protein
LKWLEQQVAAIKQGIAAMKDASASDAAIASAEKARDSALHACHKASEDARGCIDKFLGTLTACTAMLDAQQAVRQGELEGLEAHVAVITAQLDTKASDQSHKVILRPLHPQCVDLHSFPLPAAVLLDLHLTSCRTAQ